MNNILKSQQNKEKDPPTGKHKKTKCKQGLAIPAFREQMQEDGGRFESSLD